MIFMSNSSIKVEEIKNDTSSNYLGIDYKYNINILVYTNIFLNLFILQKPPQLHYMIYSIPFSSQWKTGISQSFSRTS